MMKTKLAIAALAVAGMAASPLTAEAKSYKHTRHHSSSTTTGANLKPSGGTRGNTSSQGNVGPGTTNNSGPTAGGR